MKVMRNPDGQAPAKLNRFMMTAAGLCLIMVSVTVLPSLFIRQTEVVTITRVGAAREFRSRKAFKIWPKYRSNKPQSSFKCCGLVMSDHGSFDLPETTWLHLFGAFREALHDGLVAGCSYRIVVAGSGLKLERGSPMSSRNRTLQCAVPLGDCAILGEP